MIPDVIHRRNICPRTAMHGFFTGRKNNRRTRREKSRSGQSAVSSVISCPSDRPPLREECGPQIDADGHRFQPPSIVSASICVYLWAKRAAHPRARTSCASIRPRYFFNARLGGIRWFWLLAATTESNHQNHFEAHQDTTLTSTAQPFCERRAERCR